MQRCLRVEWVVRWVWRWCCVVESVVDSGIGGAAWAVSAAGSEICGVWMVESAAGSLKS